MSKSITTTNKTAIDKIEELLVTGNLNQFSAQERVEYVNRVCDTIGINPLTRPFEFVTFQGKLVMYATKNCAEQLRKVNEVSIRITKQEIIEGVFFVTVEAEDKHGRVDSDLGVINIGNLKGDALANAVMKGITKAKRRVTLSICGLGMMDETEIDALTYNYDENSQLHGLPEKTLRDIDQRLHEKKMIKDAPKDDPEDIKKEVIEIKGFLTVLTQGMEPQAKGLFMFNNLGIRSFGELESWSLADLKEKSEMLGKQAEAQKRAELKKKQEEKPSFTLEE